MARPRRSRVLAAPPVLALLAALAATTVAGCATAPSDGTPRSLTGQSTQQQAYVQPLPPPAPDGSWTAEQVVLGFLAANASFELDPAAARQYLASGVQWKPSGAVTVVSGNLTAKPITMPRTAAPPVAEVTVQGQRLATLSSRGQYVYQPQPAGPQYTFSLQKIDGIYKIQSPLPERNTLLLTQAAFNQVFQPRNLYFFGPSSSGSPGYLIPDPVFAPVQSPTVANTTSLARELVNGLLVDSNSWLSGATKTAFLPGTKLLRVTIADQTALVDLGGAAAGATQPQLSAMLRQLSETLTSSSYSAPVVQKVRLAINGRTLRQSAAQAVVPPVGGQSESLYFAAGGQLYQWHDGKTTPLTSPVPAGAGQQITTLAVSSGQNPLLAAAVPQDGCTIYARAQGSARPFAHYRLGPAAGECTSLSWGVGDSLWAVAGSRVWLLRPGQVQQVSLPVPARTKVLSLQMAPDGIRAALLVESGGHTSLLLAAAAYSPSAGAASFGQPIPVGVGLRPTAVSWYNPDELLALGGPGSELHEVPLTGGQPTQLGSVAASSVDSIATNGSAVAARTSGDVIYTAPGPGGPWNPVKSRTPAGPADPVYPG